MNLKALLMADGRSPMAGQCGISRHSTRHPPSAIRHSTAFTLLEIMLAVAIFSMVLAAIYSTWSLILRASKTGQEAAAQVQRRRIAVRTIEDALTCIQSFQASSEYYTFVVQNGSDASLSFTARLPDHFPRNGEFGAFNLRRLNFTVETGPDSEKDLMLRQNPILMDLSKDEQETPLILARNVKKFVVQCWDTNQMQWDDEWDQTNVIPPLIRVTLTMGGKPDNFGGEGPELSVTRLIAIPSQTVPTIVQAPGVPLRPPGQFNPFQRGP
ncbi:MAG: prepilin-type N-terminal cleavage/methylation domain-containing protein [Verrucomicrobiota bacterium]|nr:prepilin-type N-terminal cleavage/methylation domain-containing protein [Verrucomicrobiota bacterium]